MPRLVRDFPAAAPGSLYSYSVDFAPYVPPGASLVSASWTLGMHALLPGAVVDPTPQVRLAGAPWIAPNSATPPRNTVAAQRIGGALHAGEDYLVSVTGTTSDGEVVILWTVLPCRTPQ